MATIIKKIKKGNPYYYAVQSARVNGKPRIVWQKYLGTLDAIVKRAEGAVEKVTEVDIFEAGGVAAMLQIANKIGLAEIIDEVIPKRSDGPSVGQYILVAIINRVVGPCSKLQMPKWYDNSILRRIWKYSPEVFTSQRFWDHMNLFSDKHIEEIQRRVTNKVLETYDINTERLLYDTTNFASSAKTKPWPSGERCGSL